MMKNKVLESLNAGLLVVSGALAGKKKNEFNNKIKILQKDRTGFFATGNI